MKKYILVIANKDTLIMLMAEKLLLMLRVEPISTLNGPWKLQAKDFITICLSCC